MTSIKNLRTLKTSLILGTVAILWVGSNYSTVPFLIYLGFAVTTLFFVVFFDKLK